MEGHLYLALVLEGLVGLRITGQLQLFSISGCAWTWITVMLNGLPWKQIEILLLFLRLHPSTAFWTPVDYEDYSVSSMGFLATVIDIMVI